MKGYDVVVFPREGEPTLIVLEPQQEDAERTAWTTDIRLFDGYDERDPRPPTARALELAQRGRARGRLRARRARALARHADGRPHGRRADDLHAGLLRRVRAGARTRRRSSSQARAIKTEQEIERMRLANELAAEAMEHVRRELRPGMSEGEAAALWEGFVHGAGHRLPGPGRAGARLLARLVGPGHPHVHRDRRPARSQEREPTLFEIWVCVDGYWCDHTKNVCPGELTRRVRRAARAGCSASTARRSTIAGRARASPSSTCSSATGSPRPAIPASRRTRSPRRRRPRARAALRAPGRWRHDPGGHGAGDRAGLLLGGRRRPAPRGQLPRSPRTAPRSSRRYPDDFRAT